MHRRFTTASLRQALSDHRISLLPDFDFMAFGFPLLKSSEERAAVRNAKLSERERRTGARFLRLSTAVGDDRLGELS